MLVIDDLGGKRSAGKLVGRDSGEVMMPRADALVGFKEGRQVQRLNLFISQAESIRLPS